MRSVHVWIDDFGAFPMTRAEIVQIGRAKKRQDGWWDLRTKSGREAAEYFRGLQRERQELFLKDDNALDAWVMARHVAV